MKVTGFGDFLIHFSPLEYERFFQTDLMKMSFTGAEANVCCALSLWGEKVNFVTAIPENSLAKKGIMFLNSFNVNTDFIKKGEGRMGAYYLEKGFSIRPSQVIYDRDFTVFANSTFSDYDWDEIFSDTDIFYLSGITPSLSQTLFDCCKEALAQAKKRNIPVFFDLNLRPKICDIQRSREIFNELKQYITHLIANEEHLKQLLSLESAPLNQFAQKVKAVTNIENVIVTVRRTLSANKTKVFAVYFSENDFAISPQYDVDVVDRVGSGDAFSAGIVYSFIHNYSAQQAINFAMASGALKHTINNDINFSTVEEIKSLMEDKACDVRR